MADQLDFETSTCPPALPPSLLPLASSPDLILIPATPLEYIHTCHLNGDEWSGPLTMSQYFTREQHLLNQPLTRENRIVAWILTSTHLPNNPDGTRPILAACETLLCHAYVARNGKLFKIFAHGIASVFTRREHRGKGYAQRMMKELGTILDTWQQPAGTKGTFSVLFSDIGPKFYANMGWKAFPSTDILLPAIDSEHTYEETKSRLNLPEVSALTAADLPGIPTIPYLESELVYKSTQTPDVPHVAIRADIEHFGWHHAREEVQSSILGLPEPTIKGAVHNSTGAALIWTRVFATKPEEWQLVVLKTVLPVSEVELGEEKLEEVEMALAALLLRAQLEATRSSLQAGVQVWSPEPIVVRAAQRLREGEGKVAVVARDMYSICSLRWVAGQDEAEKVVWLGKEKYAWC